MNREAYQKKFAELKEVKIQPSMKQQSFDGPKQGNLFIDEFSQYHTASKPLEFKGAEFSPDRKYRYALWRVWDIFKPKLMIIGLNPSKAK